MQSARVRFLVCVIVFGGCNWSGSKDSEHTGSGGDNGSGGAASTGTGGSVTTGSGGITGNGGSDVDAATGGTGGLAVDDGGAPEVPACGMQTFKLESTPPDLLVVL